MNSGSRIFITGAAGEIGCVLRAGLYGDSCTLRLLDIKPQAARPGEEVRDGRSRHIAALAGGDPRRRLHRASCGRAARRRMGGDTSEQCYRHL